MKRGRQWLIFFAAVLCLLAGLIWLTVSTPKNPVALLQVVDAAGKPVAGAVIVPEGLRTKPGPYSSGWYGWATGENTAPNKPVITDKAGYARVQYPKFVFEHIETGVIIFSVNHPDFVPDRPERVVSTAPPKGAPWKVWRDYVWDRIQHRVNVVRPDKVVLLKGASLKLSVKPGSAAPKDAKLFAQISAGEGEDTNFWQWPESDMLITHRLAAGPQTLRAIEIESSGSVWFSDVVTITAVSGQTNEVAVDLKRGVAVHGRLDAGVPRPVRNGRIIAHVWPQGHKPQDSPPQWHAWSVIREDGSFDINSLPEGDLEVVALCDGFVNTNGPGKYKFIYPQKYALGTNDLAITVGMEPTARLEVHVMDDEAKPLPGAHVSAWPNVRYGEWAAVILGSDCYNMSDLFLPKPGSKPIRWWRQPVPDLEGTSGSTGIAVLSNLPVMVKQISVDHTNFELPAIEGFGGQKQRLATITLKAGETNEVYIKLEPRGKSPIAHY